jgi:hypothetical protein
VVARVRTVAPPLGRREGVARHRGSCAEGGSRIRAAVGSAHIVKMPVAARAMLVAVKRVLAGLCCLSFVVLAGACGGRSMACEGSKCGPKTTTTTRP